MNRTNQILSFLVLILCAVLITGCNSSKNKIPDNVPDIIERIYKNMSDLKSYSTKSTLSMDMVLSGTETKSVFETTVGMQMNPLELTILHNNTVGGESSSSYIYGSEEENEMQLYCFENGQWTKDATSQESVEKIKEQYASPIEFDLYFVNIDSFEISESGEETTVLEGTVSKENVVEILKETGVLKQLSLTSFPEETIEKMEPISVKVWVNNKTVCIEKFELDMTKTYQNLCSILFTEESKVNPEIKECKMVIDEIQINEELEVILPEDAKKALDDLREEQEK